VDAIVAHLHKNLQGGEVVIFSNGALAISTEAAARWIKVTVGNVESLNGNVETMRDAWRDAVEQAAVAQNANRSVSGVASTARNQVAVQRFNLSTFQPFNDSTIHRFNDSTINQPAIRNHRR
jgi:hypothetical protein